MEPTVVTNDILLTEQLSPRLGLLERGDIVIARAPADLQVICKRVVGLPGDSVLFQGRLLQVIRQCPDSNVSL